MRPHRGERVQIGEPALDVQPLYGVGVVRRPDLRRETEHAEVEAVPAGGAALEEDVRPRVEHIALSKDCNVIFYGAHSDDAAGSAYPDCSDAFNQAMKDAIYLGSGNQVTIH